MSRKIIILVLILALLILSYNLILYKLKEKPALKPSWEEIITLDDVTGNKMIILSSKNKDVNRITLHISGYIDGKAIILQSNKRMTRYKYHLEPGKVNLMYNGFWDDDRCVVGYTPHKVKSGELMIKYKFHNVPVPSQKR